MSNNWGNDRTGRGSRVQSLPVESDVPDPPEYYEEDCEVAGSSMSIPEVVEAFAAKGKMWAVSDDTNYFACDAAVDTLPPSQYLIRHCESRGFYFERKEVHTDGLISLPDAATEQVVAGIEHFWTRRESFAEFGFLWKRGVMLWGPPGSGKTSCVQQLSQMFVARGGISVYMNTPGYDAMGLKTLRQIEPDRPILVMIEDIDAIVKRHGEAELLALLDGELQIDNVVYVATTNYPELLDKRIVCRPSRFDEVIYIGMPSAASRAVYLQTKNPRLSEFELKRWVEATNDFSVAQLKEVIVSVECLGNDFDTTVKRLRDMERPPSSEDGEIGSFGFGNGGNG